MNLGKYYNYSDICLVPKLGVVNSRQDVLTTTKFLDRTWNLPIVPANMKCVIDFKIAEELENNGNFYILHRFYEYDEILKWAFDKKDESFYLSLSIGVNEKDYKFIDDLYKNNISIDCLTIDIAHGHCSSLQNMVSYIKKMLPKCKIIGGNVSTLKAVQDLEKWGVDAVKVGIANGKSCITYNKTGVGTPMFTTVENICKNTTIPIIADGGVREHGDISKALVAGASMVMIGSMFASLSDSPAKVKKNYEQFEPYKFKDMNKIFYGSASVENKGYSKNIEGKKVLLEYNPQTYKEKYQEIREDLQSTISYLGGWSMDVFKEEIDYVIS